MLARSNVCLAQKAAMSCLYEEHSRVQSLAARAFGGWNRPDWMLSLHELLRWTHSMMKSSVMMLSASLLRDNR